MEILAVMSKKKKKQQLEKLKPKKYKIYGIFNFKEKRIIYVDLDLDKIELEFDLEGYDPKTYDIVSFDIMLA